MSKTGQEVRGYLEASVRMVSCYVIVLIEIGFPIRFRILDLDNPSYFHGISWFLYGVLSNGW